MSDEQKARKEEVFGQALSRNEFDAAAGGGYAPCTSGLRNGKDWDPDWNNCT